MRKHVEHHQRAQGEEEVGIQVAEDDAKAGGRRAVSDHVEHRPEVRALLQRTSCIAIRGVERLAAAVGIETRLTRQRDV